MSIHEEVGYCSLAGRNVARTIYDNSIVLDGPSVFRGHFGCEVR